MHRILGTFPLVLGFLGVAACLLGAYASWELATGARAANRQLFDAADHGLNTAETRLRRVQATVGNMRITREEFEEKIKSITQNQARERIAEELELAQRADRLSAMIDVADARLESALDSLGTLQKLLELCRSAGADVNPATIQEVSAVVAGVRGDFQQVGEKVREVRDFGKAIEGESEGNRIARVVRVLTRVLATIADLDSRLNVGTERLEGLRIQTHTWQHRADVAIQRILAVALLVLVWIAAGQWTLFRSGWRGFNRKL